MSDWISVKDRLPNERKQVLCCVVNRFGDEYFNAHHIRSTGWTRHDKRVYVDYWMPLPKSPAPTDAENKDHD